jgi:hypothetical protein
MDRRVFSFTARVDDGTLKISLKSLQRLRAAIKGWRRCVVTVTIAAVHATRSLEQNRYYFGVVLRTIAEHTGHTVDDLHEFFKAHCLPKHLAICDGNGVLQGDLVVGGSTRQLDKVQFGEYVESIRQFAAERLDVTIPDPDPEWQQ